MLDGVDLTTRETGNRKGKYKKGDAAGKILREIDPRRIIEAAPHCKKLFDAIAEKIK